MRRTIKLVEKAKCNLNEDNNSNWFSNRGLEVAKDFVAKQGRLNVCEKVSEEVVKTVGCPQSEVVEASVYCKNNVGSGARHHVILNRPGKIIDYTQKQFFGSNSPEDVRCDIVREFNPYFEGTSYKGGIFTNNEFIDNSTGKPIILDRYKEEIDNTR